MKKFVLTKEHVEKSRVKHPFVLRHDIFGSYLHRVMSREDYFAFNHSYPDEASKIIMDGMYSGDWYSVYESEIIPQRHNEFLDRLRLGGVDIFAEHIKRFKERGKECWISHRISEVEIDNEFNPPRVREEHPDWFIPAFGYHMLNMSVPEVREHKLRILEEMMRKYPFDGLDIDFERHTPILPVGRQWENRECITDFMRRLRSITLKIEREESRVVMLSARVPDCLLGCKEDGLDIRTWVEEGLIDCLTLGSRSFDHKVEEFRALSDEIGIYDCYDTHHAVDGYALPELSLMHGVWDSWYVRGADGCEYFNWCGEGNADLVLGYVKKYGLDPIRDGYVKYAKESFVGANDREYLAACDKTYVVERRGGYPWGIGYGNLNAHSPLPMEIKGEGEVRIFVSDVISKYASAELHAIFSKSDSETRIYLEKAELTCQSKEIRDMQITYHKEAPVSGYGVTKRLLAGIDESIPCTLLCADITGFVNEPGYLSIRIKTDGEALLEKLEISVKGKIK